MTFLAAAGWTLAVVFLYWFALSAAESIRPGALGDLVTRTTCGALAYSLALLLILRVHEPEGSIRRILAVRPPALLALPLAVVVGGGLSAPVAWLDDVLLARFPPTPEEQETIEKVYGVATYDTTGKRIALVVTVILVMPILDELFFRGALFTPLRRAHRLGPVILATAAYETLVSTAHAREMLGFCVLALVVSSVRGVSGSVLPSILARISFYAPRFLPLALGRSIVPASKALLVSSLAASAAALALLALVSRRSRVAHAELERITIDDG